MQPAHAFGHAFTARPRSTRPHMHACRFGKDGTDALLDAHPGGKAFIKHTLGPKDFEKSYKGKRLLRCTHAHMCTVTLLMH
jgi:hypothetical protein